MNGIMLPLDCVEYNSGMSPKINYDTKSILHRDNSATTAQLALVLFKLLNNAYCITRIFFEQIFLCAHNVIV